MSKLARGPKPASTTRGCVYLICFRDPQTGEHATFGHAGHYTGFTKGTSLAVARRLSEHREGKGANLTRRAVRAGLVLELGRVWKDVPRSYEWTIKRKGNGNKICTLCGVTPRKRRTP
jgi:predicted GIY-YIG superfamily endonuclease